MKQRRVSVETGKEFENISINMKTNVPIMHEVYSTNTLPGRRGF